MNVAVLGHKGMLGATVARRWREFGATVATTDMRYPADPLVDWARGHDLVINCIAYTGPDRYLLASINYRLPAELDIAGCRLIQPSTDARWDEGSYARSKRLGERGLVIRCSIVGERPMLTGYTDWTWNGITTLAWADVAWSLRGADPRPVYVPYTPTVTRAELAILQAHALGYPEPKTLASGLPRDRAQVPRHEVGIPMPHIEQQLVEFAAWFRSSSAPS